MAIGVNQETRALFASEVMTVAGGNEEEVSVLFNTEKVTEGILWVKNESSSVGAVGFKLETAMSTADHFFVVENIDYVDGGPTVGTNVDNGDEHLFYIPALLAPTVATAGMIHKKFDDSLATETTVIRDVTTDGIQPLLVQSKLSIRTAATNGAYTVSASFIYRG